MNIETFNFLVYLSFLLVNLIFIIKLFENNILKRYYKEKYLEEIHFQKIYPPIEYIQTVVPTHNLKHIFRIDSNLIEIDSDWFKHSIQGAKLEFCQEQILPLIKMEENKSDFSSKPPWIKEYQLSLIVGKHE